MSNCLRYDTKEKQIEFLSKKGNIVTFKNSIGYDINFKKIKQIIVKFLHKWNGGGCQIIGNYDSPACNNIDELIDLIDWDWMENSHPTIAELRDF